MMIDYAPTVTVKLVARQGRGFERWSARVGMFSGYSNDPIKAIAQALAKIVATERFWWSNNKAARPWRGARVERTNPVHVHRNMALLEER